MARRGRIFTPATVGMMRRLADQGRSATEIADVIGSTAASVRVKCCHLKIKLRRRRGSSAAHQLHDIRGAKLNIYLRPVVYAGLKQRADALHKSVADLAATLLEAVANSDIYDAVLDERE